MTLTADDRATLIGACPLFRGLVPDDLAAVAAAAIEVDFPAERAIARQGEIGTGFFIVVSGRVRVVRDGVAVAHLGPGEFFGELSILDGGPRVAQVVTDEPTVCLAIASWDFEALLEEQPKLAIAILRGVARRLRDVTDQHRN